MKPWEYRYIAAWRQMGGSPQYYIDAMQAKAAAEGAPGDSVYFSITGGRWARHGGLEPGGPAAFIDRLRRAAEGADLVRGLGTNDR